MSICKDCGQIGGWHKTWCTRPRTDARGFEMIEPKPEPEPEQEYRIEITGNLVNYIPVKRAA